MFTYDAIPLNSIFTVVLFGLAIVLLAVDAMCRQRKVARLRRELDELSERMTALEQARNHLPIPKISSGPLVPDSDSVLNLIPPARFREPRPEQLPLFGETVKAYRKLDAPADFNRAFDQAIETVSRLTSKPPLPPRRDYDHR